jgi:hypothetical protein
VLPPVTQLQAGALAKPETLTSDFDDASMGQELGSSDQEQATNDSSVESSETSGESESQSGDYSGLEASSVAEPRSGELTDTRSFDCSDVM